jgi:glyoxylase-like metal-dependent hydrolase (beta-lactamase superfamily II)
MAKNKNENAILRYDILVLKRRGVTRELPSGTESLQWVTNTATLIYGEHDAVVVDTFATIDQNQQLVDWITKSGKNLATIYITHAHGDHSFGIKILLDRFPNARAVAAPAIVKAMQITSRTFGINSSLIKFLKHLLFQKHLKVMSLN